MPSVFSGTLSGSGTIHISDTGVVPTDIDVWVDTIGTQVAIKGDPGHRLLVRAGWVQFYFEGATVWPGQPSEASTPAIWFNSESEDIFVPIVPGGQATDFYYWVAPGTQVHINVSA